jgi:hypothetical protein
VIHLGRDGAAAGAAAPGDTASLPDGEPRDAATAADTDAFDADPGFDLDQTPGYDPTEPGPVPDFDFDQSAGA